MAKKSSHGKINFAQQRRQAKKQKKKQDEAALAEEQSRKIVTERRTTPDQQAVKNYQPLSDEPTPLQMEDRFHNPYHFVPVLANDLRRSDRAAAARWLDKNDFNERCLGRHTHARYLDKTDAGEPLFSGRLIAKLTVENDSYLFIGAGKKTDTQSASDQEESPEELKHFELVDGSPALPATSLRGLLSSIAETASNSALRVLDDSLLSYRQAVDGDEKLSALGMIVTKGDGDHIEYCLQPLTPPTINKDKKRNCYFLPKNYKTVFPKDPWSRLKVYVDPQNLASVPSRSYSAEHAEYYYMRLNSDWSESGDDNSLRDTTNLRFPTKDLQDKKFLIGQEPLKQDAGGPYLLTEDEWRAELVENPQAQFTRGLLRMLKVGANRTDMPSTKEHELFIPYTEEHAKTVDIPITQKALERFYALADERTDRSENAENADPHPYKPVGTARNDDPDQLKGKARLRNGDIVYFKLADNGLEAEAISFSSVWRSQVVDANKNPANVHRFFRAIDSEILPFNSKRQAISPAELLFGFVEDDGTEEALALAGRVSVSFGQLAPNNVTPYSDYEITTKILDSPKVPSPALYFKPQDPMDENKYIAKADLKPHRHIPQGRKYYLHPHTSQKKPWETRDKQDRPKQKVRFQPVNPGTEFYFHIDFDNLSDWELGLLCYSLRPTDQFRHKLGLAKGLGMGKVCIDPVGLFCIDRILRYRQRDAKHRYHTCSTDSTVGQWPPEYQREQAEAEQIAKMQDWQSFRDIFSNTIPTDVRTALELLGDPSKVDYDVHTPVVKEKKPFSPKHYESETFRWFVANDNGSGSGKDKIPKAQAFLPALGAESDELPTLPKHNFADGDSD